MRFVDHFERNGLMDAGIGEYDIDPAVITRDAIIEPRKVVEAVDVALHADRAMTDPADSLIEQRLSPRGDVYQCAFLRETLRGCQPDAVAATGYHHDLVFETLCHHITFKQVEDCST